MSSLDNIVKKILLDAENEKKDILSDAEEIQEKNLIRSSNESKDEVENIMERAKRQGEQIKEKKVSAATLRSRDIKLAAKQEVVDKVLDRVVETLENMDDQKYLEYLEKSLGSLSLDSKDEVRVQKDKLDVVKNANLKYNISDETVNSGFSILKGNILYNNDFKSLVESRKDDFELEIVKSLF
ncbi:MAG: V-type ATP synthase subunit E family protein [Tissierellia bacterium]|nr:V-type ATP synthase subunit E family protein [Tissierellia bacterium]